jgi:hypothetical protein
MAETHVISALTSKRAEVSGEIRYYENLLKKSKLNLQSIDQTIHLFDESYDFRTIKTKRVSKERYFKTEEAKVLILDMLRTATDVHIPMYKLENDFLLCYNNIKLTEVNI